MLLRVTTQNNNTTTTTNHYTTQVQHQKADWQNHKRVCKILQSFLDLTHYPPLPTPCSHDAWWSRRVQRVNALDVLLKLSGVPRLDSVEREMVFHARHCEVCHITDKDQLSPCRGCHMVSYCCPEHQAEDLPKHEPLCRRMHFALRCLQTTRGYDLTPTWIPPTLCHEARNLPPDWTTYFNFRGQPTMPGPETALVSSVLSVPLSILYALERIPLVPRNTKGEACLLALPPASAPPAARDGEGETAAAAAAVSRGVGLAGHKELVLHVIGATQTSEMMAITKYEEILHLCPGLDSLVVVLFGPALECRREHIRSEEILCDSCCERGRRFTVICCGDLYHDALPTLPHFPNGNPIPPTASDDSSTSFLVTSRTLMRSRRFRNGIHVP